MVARESPAGRWVPAGSGPFTLCRGLGVEAFHQAEASVFVFGRGGAEGGDDLAGDEPGLEDALRVGPGQRAVEPCAGVARSHASDHGPVAPRTRRSRWTRARAPWSCRPPGRCRSGSARRPRSRSSRCGPPARRSAARLSSPAQSRRGRSRRRRRARGAGRVCAPSTRRERARSARPGKSGEMQRIGDLTHQRLIAPTRALLDVINNVIGMVGRPWPRAAWAHARSTGSSNAGSASNWSNAARSAGKLAHRDRHPRSNNDSTCPPDSRSICPPKHPICRPDTHQPAGQARRLFPGQVASSPRLAAQTLARATGGGRRRVPRPSSHADGRAPAGDGICRASSTSWARRSGTTAGLASRG
jgi:hypothetical protein